MRLYLVRHGIAVDREDRNCPPDPKRYLTPEGIKKTRAAMRGLAGMGATADAMLTSPYLRAAQTAEIAADVLGFPADKIVSTDALLPGAAPGALLKDLAKAGGDDMMCFGHAPHLDIFLAHCVGNRGPITQLKKAGVACLEMEKLSAGAGILVWLLSSKALRQFAE
jgi:phosphohistidine phosphatase